MKYDEFINRVQEGASLESREQAEKATRATLGTLVRHLSEGEKQDLASQLPEPLKRQVLAVSGSRERFSLEEFFTRVQQEEGGVDRRETERHARAVAGVMSDAVTRGELTDVFSQLPGDFGDLFTAKSV